MHINKESNRQVILENRGPKVTFLLGLAGSGKSYHANRLKKERGAEFFEGTHGDDNTETKKRLLMHLRSGGSCIVEEIAYCIQAHRKEIESELRNVSPNVEIEWICLENDLASANWNVIHRNDDGKKNIQGHLRINKHYHNYYTYPSNVKLIPIFRINP